MIAEKNKYMSEAAVATYELNADEIVRQQCMAREEYNRHEKMMQRKLAEKELALQEKDQALHEKDKILQEKDQALVEANEQREQLQAEIARLQELLAQKQQ